MTALEKKIEKHKQKCSRNKTHGAGGYLRCFTFQELMRKWHVQNHTPPEIGDGMNVETNEKVEKARIEERKLETIEKIALLSFAVSHASPKPLTPPEAYQRARAFVEHALSVNPDATFRL